MPFPKKRTNLLIPYRLSIVLILALTQDFEILKNSTKIGGTEEGVSDHVSREIAA